MSSLNKQSVREEAERIKSEFDRLSLDKKINSETRMLIQSMFMLINLLISIFLEKTTSKYNKNSSKPSSQTEKDESSTSKKKTNKFTGKRAEETLLSQREFISLSKEQEGPEGGTTDQNKKQSDSGHEPQCEGKLKRRMSDKLSPHED